MAKKAIGKVKGGVKKIMAKVILPVKSAVTGTYKFKTTVMLAEEVQAFIEKQA